MSLAIISSHPDPAARLASILTHYFGAHSPLLISITTKYYTCTVPLLLLTPADLLSHPQDHKIDSMLFLFHNDETVEAIKELIDGSIDRFQPESYMVVVHGEQDCEKEWQYQDAIAECENFVSVVYEDIEKVLVEKPEWKQGGLLSESDEDIQIFSLFDLLHTTVWSNTLTGSNQPTQTLPNQPPQANKEQDANLELRKQEQEQRSQEMNEEMNQEMNEEEMERQMMEFEMLMQQMMAMKDGSLKGNERKVRAEELIMKLAAGKYQL